MSTNLLKDTHVYMQKYDQIHRKTSFACVLNFIFSDGVDGVNLWKCSRRYFWRKDFQKTANISISPEPIFRFLMQPQSSRAPRRNSNIRFNEIFADFVLEYTYTSYGNHTTTLLNIRIVFVILDF